MPAMDPHRYYDSDEISEFWDSAFRVTPATLQRGLRNPRRLVFWRMARAYGLATKNISPEMPLESANPTQFLVRAPEIVNGTAYSVEKTLGRYYVTVTPGQAAHDALYVPLLRPLTDNNEATGGIQAPLQGDIPEKERLEAYKRVLRALMRGLEIPRDSDQARALTPILADPKTYEHLIPSYQNIVALENLLVIRTLDLLMRRSTLSTLRQLRKTLTTHEAKQLLGMAQELARNLTEMDAETRKAIQVLRLERLAQKADSLAQYGNAIKAHSEINEITGITKLDPEVSLGNLFEGVVVEATQDEADRLLEEHGS